MPHRLLIIAGCLLLLWGCAKRKDDYSSPKATAKTMAAALEAGDAKALAEGFNATTDDQRRVAIAYAKAAIAYREMRDAASKKLGTAGRDLDSAYNPLGPLENPDGAIESITGQSASLVVRARPATMPFVKSGSTWKVDASALAVKGEPDLPTRLGIMQRAFETVQKGITSGQHGAIEQARDALERELREGMLK